MPAESRPRIEWTKTKGFGRRCIDDFVNVDSKQVAHQSHLIDHADIDAAKCVLQEFYHFRALAAADFNHPLDKLRIKKCRYLAAIGGDAADDLRRVVGVERGISWIDPLRRKGQIEIATGAQARSFKFWQNQLVCGSRIGRALQDNELIFVQIFSNLSGGSKNKRDIRVTAFTEGRRHADADSVDITQCAKIVGRGKLAMVHGSSNIGRRHIQDVRVTVFKVSDLAPIKIDARNFESRRRDLHHKRQSDIAETDDGCRCFSAFNFLFESCQPKSSRGC